MDWEEGARRDIAKIRNIRFLDTESRSALPERKLERPDSIFLFEDPMNPRLPHIRIDDQHLGACLGEGNGRIDHGRRLPFRRVRA